MPVLLATLIGRTVADRTAPTSRAWRAASDIDAADIAAALGVDRGAVAGISVTDVDHGTTQRSRLVVRHRDGNETALFVKNTPVKLGARLLDTVTKLCEREAAFYRGVAPQVASAPHALLTQWDSRTGRSTVVLGDLTDEGFEFLPAAEPCTPDQVDLALDVFADLHAVATGKVPAASEPIHALDTPGMRRVSRVACRAVGRGPSSLVGIVPEQVIAEARILATHPGTLGEALTTFPQCFVHNDTHRGNIGFAADRAVLIDWQYCGWGAALKDVAYLMSTALEPEDRRAHERDFLHSYLARVESAGGPAMDREDAWFAYRLLSITGYVAASVSTMFRERLQVAANSEQTLRRASAAVQDLESFTALRHHIDDPRSSRDLRHR